MPLVLARELNDDEARLTNLTIRSYHGSGKGLERENKRPSRSSQNSVSGVVIWAVLVSDGSEQIPGNPLPRPACSTVSAFP